MAKSKSPAAANDAPPPPEGSPHDPAKPSAEASGGLIDVGRKAPAFNLKDQHGRPHKLADYAGTYVVLYFYPKDDTPGCTTEACGFRDHDTQLQQAGAVVLGVSPDDEKSHGKFAGKYDLNFPLLADLDAKLARKYGVWQEKNMYGRKYMGVARTTYLIGPDGKVAHRWDKVKPKEHAEQVLAAITEASGG